MESYLKLRIQSQILFKSDKKCKFEIFRSECGTGWVFSRDLRHRVGSLYGLYNHNLEQVATNIHCKHLLIKVTLLLLCIIIIL